MPGPQRYDIFEAKFHSLKDDMIGKKYKAILHEDIITGLVDPRVSHDIEPDCRGSVEAKNPQEAVQLFRKDQENHLFYT